MDAAESRAAARAAVRNTSPPAPAAPARAAPAPGTFVECRFTYDVPGEAQSVRWERGRVIRVWVWVGKKNTGEPFIKQCRVI